MILLCLSSFAFADDVTQISQASVADQGILVHDVTSPHQAGPTQMRVLLPLRKLENQRLPVVYVLPVEANRENRYGDGLAEIQKLKLPEKYNAIFVAPTFAHLPWYADHPTDVRLRQESYFLRSVVPFVEQTYPAVKHRDGRWLLGFSKSGWGAWTLLLRHPETFSRAAAWDAPLAMVELGKYGSTPIFGTQAQFDKYRPDLLLPNFARAPHNPSRLILTGYGNFREHHQQTHARLNELGISHIYRDGPSRPHDWHSGWVGEAVELLVSDQ